MVNVGSGNLLLQDSDMEVPHKGITLGFRRTYNSQSQHDVNGTDGSAPSMYGNGWTNTFDAHLSGSTPGVTTVWDVDGARYDYTLAGDGVTWIPPAGQHATLTWDHGCGFLWTKKSGASYYFWQAPNGPCGPTYGGQYAGKLYQIIGRNRNTYVTFNYGWDIGTHTAGDKISSITATTESGLATNLSFTDVSGHRLLQQIVFPDGGTSVSYLYDAAGNLTWVSRPPNNAAGTRPMPGYIYSTLGAGSVLAYVTSPRWNGSDGGYIALGYNGTDAHSATVSYLAHVANVNPPIADGSGSSTLQSGYPTTPYNFYNEYFTTGAFASTYRDTNGHVTNWVIDGRGRPTQTQVCTITPAPGTPCPSQSLLVMNESWDINNNRTAVVDPRGGETDAAYDAAGNLVAIAQPQQYQGYGRPTTLIDYDSSNNVTAECDPVFVHSHGADWSGQYSGGLDNYCSALGSANHPHAGYTYPSYEPNGELTSVTSARGYTTSIYYDPAAQGGVDYGLPTKISGALIQQFDQTTKQSSTSATYDASGNVMCGQTDAGTGAAALAATTVMTYDSLNRLVASADADDASLTGSCSAKVSGIAGSSIVTTRTYYPDGSLATTRTPSEAALNYGTTYTYDIDGDPMSEAPYVSSPQNPLTARVKRWFDGTDRLIETQQPADPATPGDIPISLRFLYDLSQGGSAVALAGAAVTAHGNLFDTVKNTPTGWIDFRYSAFDASNRVTMAYAFSPCPAQTGSPGGAIYCSQSAYATRYDWDSSPALNPGVSAPGLLVAMLDATGASRKFTYDGLNEVDSINYAGDGGVTTPVQYAYDFDGRIYDTFAYFNVSSAPAQNRVTYTYSADGTLAQKAYSALRTIIAYNYYSDSSLAGVSAVTTQGTWGDVVNQPNLYRYAYRNDGALANESFGVTNQSVGWTYTRGGRMTAMRDFSGASPSVSAQYADGSGRLSTYTTPSGTYGSFTYDPQGRMTRYTDPYASVDGETVNSTYNVRGDLVSRTFTGGSAATKPGFQYKNIQGVLVQNPGDQWDGRTGATVLTPDSGAFSYDQAGRLTNVGGGLSYDAENRLVSGDTWNAATAADPGCLYGGTAATAPAPELTYLYDAAGQLFQDKSQGGFVGGHPQQPIRQWFWNNSTPLYTAQMTSAGGNFRGLDGFSADGLGSITPDGSSPGLTISDNDFDGAVAQYHNNTGHSSWAASNAYNQFCQHANPLPASANYVGPNGNAVPSDTSSDASLTVSSVGRAYLSRAMGFTTPDYSSAMPYSSGTRRISAERSTHADSQCPSGEAYDDTGECTPSNSDGLGRVPARCCNPPELPEPEDFPPIIGAPDPRDIGWPEPNTHGLGGIEDPFGFGVRLRMPGLGHPGGLGGIGLFRTFGLAMSYNYDPTFQGGAGAYRLLMFVPVQSTKVSWTCYFQSRDVNRTGFGMAAGTGVSGPNGMFISHNTISQPVLWSQTMCRIRAKGGSDAIGVSFL